jgi:ABC-type antimicrobial peptide transport system permease subunit
VVAYFVSQRTREIGVRMALGATSRDVLALVVRQGMAALLGGLLVGLLAGLAGARLLQSVLFETAFFDPATLGIVVVVMATVAVLASGIPAHRATRVDPTRALADV